MTGQTGGKEVEKGMNAEEMRFYTNGLVWHERQKHNKSPESPCKWPGKRLNANALSKYPNIIAFLRCSVSPWVPSAAEIAGISPEEMAAVIEDNGNMTKEQLSRLANQFGCPVQWLESPSLLQIDPKTIKGWGLAKKIEDLLNDAKGLALPENGEKWVEMVERSFRANETITYASYVFAIRTLKFAKRHRLMGNDYKYRKSKTIYIPCETGADQLTTERKGEKSYDRSGAG